MIDRNAYRKVLDDIARTPILNGTYDARNCDVKFMYGIALAVEFIAHNAGYDEFMDGTFYTNMFLSEDGGCE